MMYWDVFFLFALVGKKSHSTTFAKNECRKFYSKFGVFPAGWLTDIVMFVCVYL